MNNRIIGSSRKVIIFALALLIQRGLYQLGLLLLDNLQIPEIPILDIKNLTVSFDGFKALDNLNFSMKAGELRVIIGPNGAGKTTFLDVITGKVQPTTGEVFFRGINLKKMPEHKIARLGIGRKFQTPRVFLNLTVRENLDLACNPHKNVLSTLLNPPRTAQRRTVAGLLETIGLEAKADELANLLSHGEKQRLEIGILVAQSPDLLLVDEPAAGLTDEETERIGDLLLDLAESHSIIAIEHDMEFVRQIARQVTVLHQGSVLFEGTMDQVQNDPKVIEVYLGSAPSITPQQMNILRVAAAMAWADNNFAPVQQELILSRLSKQFATDKQQQKLLKEELKNYFSKNISLEELVPKLNTETEKEMVLKLSYEIISSNSINEQEARAYQKLVKLLNLPPKVVENIQQAVDEKSHLEQVRSISDSQMNILRIVLAIAWSDGNISKRQKEIILSRLSEEFALNEHHRFNLLQELEQYFLQDIPLEQLIPQLNTLTEKKKVVELTYELIASNSNNGREKVAYRKLLQLLDLPKDLIEEIEREVEKRLRGW